MRSNGLSGCSRCCSCRSRSLAYLTIERRRARYAIHYTNIEVLAAVSAAGGRHWRWILPPLLALLALTCALAALARPEVQMSVASEQASIALTIDVSGSMSADDVKPTRLGAAQEAVRRFLAGLPDKYRVGLVTFSSEPYVAAPLTHDRKLVLEGLLLGDTSFGQGTAIGDALARSVEMLVPVTGEGEAFPAEAPAPPPPPDPRPAALGDPAALGRRADARRAGSAAGRCACEVVRNPGLHRRSGHARGRAESRRVLPARAARPRRHCGRSPRRPAASSSPRRARPASTRSTRISPPGSGTRTSGAS